MGKRLLQARLDCQARLGRKVNPDEVGQILGVTGVTVGRWENGKRMPTLEQIDRLAALYGTTPEWLAFRRGARDAGSPTLDAQGAASLRAAEAVKATLRPKPKRRREGQG